MTKKRYLLGVAAGLVAMGGFAVAETAPVEAATVKRVCEVIDGDTVRMCGESRTTRIIGVDTPERGQCNAGRATTKMTSLVKGKRVKITQSRGKDHYGRHLRSIRVKATKVDPAAALIRKGLADARYDGRDGYGWHKFQPKYRRLDRLHPDQKCAAPGSVPGAGCHPAYPSVCIPPPPPDLDCGDIPHRRFTVDHRFGDPHRFDGDADGIGCET